jgi:hypothetical protein
MLTFNTTLLVVYNKAKPLHQCICLVLIILVVNVYNIQRGTHLGWPGGVGLGLWSVLLSMSQVSILLGAKKEE